MPVDISLAIERKVESNENCVNVQMFIHDELSGGEKGSRSS